MAVDMIPTRRLLTVKQCYHGRCPGAQHCTVGESDVIGDADEPAKSLMTSDSYCSSKSSFGSDRNVSLAGLRSWNGQKNVFRFPFVGRTSKAPPVGAAAFKPKLSRDASFYTLRWLEGE
ncbi:hypothetical protein SCLCIDRAFT_1221082 [Scleroderma citrinum Foug A]|uniref:Uncharacterized protein n=1 Tax=Scleroderma citrinum Foug A TaxID=1036808 RepID=A0A0C3D3N6_9AGAM|nr:hypothetical protein SCLCIDRAFT_1221082 [Scleroderma citrinum Foug A]